VVPFVSSEEAEEYTGGGAKRFLRYPWGAAAKKSFRARPCEGCHIQYVFSLYDYPIRLIHQDWSKSLDSIPTYA
jgi:hypothetical protein